MALSKPFRRLALALAELIPFVPLSAQHPILRAVCSIGCVDLPVLLVERRQFAGSTIALRSRFLPLAILDLLEASAGGVSVLCGGVVIKRREAIAGGHGYNPLVALVWGVN
jgi:hypothetical protein